MGTMKRLLKEHQEQVEQAIALAGERPRLMVEAANMLLLLKAASNLICDLRRSGDSPYSIEKSINALVARVEAHS